MRRMGRMVLRETLMEAVFGMNDDIESNALDTHIRGPAASSQMPTRA